MKRGKELVPKYYEAKNKWRYHANCKQNKPNTFYLDCDFVLSNSYSFQKLNFIYNLQKIHI